MISLKDRLKMVYDGLRSLTIILKGNPDVFDEKMRDLLDSSSVMQDLLFFPFLSTKLKMDQSRKWIWSLFMIS